MLWNVTIGRAFHKEGIDSFMGFLLRFVPTFRAMLSLIHLQCSLLDSSMPHSSGLRHRHLLLEKKYEDNIFQRDCLHILKQEKIIAACLILGPLLLDAQARHLGGQGLAVPGQGKSLVGAKNSQDVN